MEFVENKVKSTIKRYKLIDQGDKVLVALSGGKDSAVLLTILSKLKARFDFNLAAVHIDLGIGKFSEESRKKAEDLAKLLGVKLIIIDLKKVVGLNLTELSLKAKRPPCSVCGLVKRYLLNFVALISGSSKLALGHNADDIMAYAFKSFLTHDLEYISKLGPFTRNIENLAVGRIRPLYEVYEKETTLYAEIMKLPVARAKCPHAKPNQTEFTLKKLIDFLERERPGLKISFLRGLIRNLAKYPEVNKPIIPCKYCGAMSSTGECSFCRLTKRVFGRPLGPNVKSYIIELVNKESLWYG